MIQLFFITFKTAWFFPLKKFGTKEVSFCSNLSFPSHFVWNTVLDKTCNRDLIRKKAKSTVKLSANESAKITNRNQSSTSPPPKKNKIMSEWQTRTLDIPYHVDRSQTPWANSPNVLNGAILIKISVWIWHNNCLETCRTSKVDKMKDFMDKLNRNINHRICEMLSSNATFKTPATTTYL